MPPSKVLIIDDDDVREALMALLTNEGYDASGARSGIAALNTMTWQRYVPDVIVLDLLMPTMDGAAPAASSFSLSTVSSAR